MYAFVYDNIGLLIGTTMQYTFLPGTYSNSYTYDAALDRGSLSTRREHQHLRRRATATTRGEETEFPRHAALSVQRLERANLAVLCISLCNAPFLFERAANPRHALR